VTNKSDFTWLLQTNSPGEISHWLTPIVREINKIQPKPRIIVFLTPCPYASGQEAEVVSKLENVVRVYSAKETMKKVFTFFMKEPIKGKGAFIFLGGDPFYSKVLGYKFQVPVYGYFERPNKINYKKIFYRRPDFDLMKSHFMDYKVTRSQALEKLNLEDKDYCLWMPGSRKAHFEVLIPTYLKAIQLIKDKHPDFNALVLISKFITEKTLEKAKRKYDFSNVTVLRNENDIDVLSISKMMLTLPGSNTTSALYLSLPTIMVIPLNFEKTFIFDGLIGILARLPLFGFLFRKLIIAVLKRRKAFYAIPNILHKKELIPEYVCRVYPENLSQWVMDLYYNPTKLAKAKEKLAAHNAEGTNPAEVIVKEIMGESGHPQSA